MSMMDYVEDAESLHSMQHMLRTAGPLPLQLAWGGRPHCLVLCWVSAGMCVFYARHTKCLG